VIAASRNAVDCVLSLVRRRKRAEGKNTKEAIRALKRQLSNVIYRTMVADARRLEQ
jgi:hypothetical protein